MNREESVAALFAQAIELDGEERARFLDRECGDDRELRAELDSLLGYDAGSGKALPLTEVAAEIQIDLPEALNQSATPPLPERIGSYRILRRIGAGGMGVVYEAEQEHPRRKVALKLMLHPFPTDKLRRRFEFEAETLGRLRHPGIAQIIEAGVAGEEQGRVPYFAMELVHGETLRDHAAQQSLSVRQKLELFVKVCDAVHHAHQSGIVHRDLKPGNILVEPDGQPKVLDFGIARSTNADFQMTSIGSEAELVGTLPYMSPLPA